MEGLNEINARQRQAQILASLSSYSTLNNLQRIMEDGRITYGDMLKQEVVYYSTDVAMQVVDQEVRRLKDAGIIVDATEYEEDGYYQLNPDMPRFARSILDVIFPPSAPDENDLRALIIEKMEEHARKIADEIVRNVKRGE